MQIEKDYDYYNSDYDRSHLNLSIECYEIESDKEYNARIKDMAKIKKQNAAAKTKKKQLEEAQKEERRLLFQKLKQEFDNE